MTSRAKVYLHKSKPYWFAWFQVWDAKRQAWRAVSKSTKSKNKTTALEIAKEYERLALAAGGPDGSTRLSREFVIGVINDILRISGHRPVDDSPTWKSYADAWLETQQARISIGSWKNFRSHLRNFEVWLGKNATLPMNAITGEMMQQWYQDQVKEGLSKTTLRCGMGILGRIFERARNEGFTQRNPVELIQTIGGKESNERDAFTIEDMDKLLTYLRADPKRRDWLTVSLLGLCTSQRLQDCARATRGQFEETPDFWVWTVKQQKTGKLLRIPIVEPLASHLREIWKAPTDSVFLAPSLAEIQARSPTGLSHQFKSILDAAGIKGTTIAKKGRKGRSFSSKTFHSTRHTCNSLLANAGIPPDIRQKITGHSNLATNMIYTHLEDETKAKALGKAFASKKSM